MVEYGIIPNVILKGKAWGCLTSSFIDSITYITEITEHHEMFSQVPPMELTSCIPREASHDVSPTFVNPVGNLNTNFTTQYKMRKKRVKKYIYPNI